MRFDLYKFLSAHLSTEPEPDEYRGLETYAALDVGAFVPIIYPARYQKLQPLRVAASLLLLARRSSCAGR